MFWLATVTRDGGWQLGLHDQTFTGWLTVALYLLATVLCLRCAMIPDRIGPTFHQRRYQIFWWVLTLCTLLLGVNKQLDLHHGLTTYLRGVARHDGWYAQRKVYQYWFIVAFGGIIAGFLVTMTLLMWGMIKRTMVAMTGLCAVMAYVVLRAASFHHVDNPVDGVLAGYVGPVRIEALVEMAGVCLIAIGAASNLIWGRERRELRLEEKFIREQRIATHQPTHAASAMLGDWTSPRPPEVNLRK